MEGAQGGKEVKEQPTKEVTNKLRRRRTTTLRIGTFFKNYLLLCFTVSQEDATTKNSLHSLLPIPAGWQTKAGQTGDHLLVSDTFVQLEVVSAMLLMLLCSWPAFEIFRKLNCSLWSGHSILIVSEKAL